MTNRFVFKCYLNCNIVRRNDGMLQCWKGFLVEVLSNHHFGGHVNEVYPKGLGNKGEGPRCSQVTLNHLEREQNSKEETKEEMVRANDSNINIFPPAGFQLLLSEDQLLFCQLLPSLPPLALLLTSFLSVTIFEIWLSPFHNSIASYHQETDINAELRRSCIPTESLHWVFTGHQIKV